MNRQGYPSGSASSILAKALRRALAVAEGDVAADQFLRESGVEPGEVEDETLAIPLANLEKLLARFAGRLGPNALGQLGPMLVEPEQLAAWVPVLRGIDRPADAMARVGSAESDQKRTQRWETVERSDHHWVGRLVIQHDPELETTAHLAHGRLAMLRVVPCFFGLPMAHKLEVEPLEKGELCTQLYRVEWCPRPNAGRFSSGVGAALGLALGAAAPLTLGRTPLAFALTFLIGAMGCGAGMFMSREAAVRQVGAGEQLRRRALERKIALEEERARHGARGLEGQLLAGTYRIRKRMGSGASGVVYEAVRTTDGRRVAMKLLLASSAHDTVASDRLRREAEALGLAWHPNVVEVLDQGQLPDGTIYLVMELLEGDSLAHRLRTGGAFLPGELLPIAIELAGALEAMHAAGVIHRDIKPDNIFLVAAENGEWRPKVLDFGIARVEWAETRITVNGVPMGTPGYMAPEQERGDDVDARADIFAFGSMMFECLTGDAAAPLTASGVARTGPTGGIIWDTLRWPRDIHVPDEWRTLVERAMAAEPGDRFQGAREILDNLRALGGVPAAGVADSAG